RDQLAVPRDRPGPGGAAQRRHRARHRPDGGRLGGADRAEFGVLGTLAVPPRHRWSRWTVPPAAPIPPISPRLGTASLSSTVPWGPACRTATSPPTTSVAPPRRAGSTAWCCTAPTSSP